MGFFELLKVNASVERLINYRKLQPLSLAAVAAVAAGSFSSMARRFRLARRRGEVACCFEMSAVDFAVAKVWYKQ